MKETKRPDPEKEAERIINKIFAKYRNDLVTELKKLLRGKIKPPPPERP
jgi:hypothetical protein